MQQTLSDILLDPDRRLTVISDLQRLIDSEVSAKSGVSGAVVKTGYAAIKKVKPGIIPSAVGSMLPGFSAALEPFYADHHAAGSTDFGAYLDGRSDEASAALLVVTDARVARTTRESIKKVYGKLRPNAKKNVAAALPRLGALIDNYAAT